MRRLWAISAFALFLSVPLFAQRGGGGHAGSFGGGSHGGGFSGRAGGFAGHAGFSGAPRMGGSRPVGGARSGFHFGSSRTFPSRFSTAPFWHDGFRGNRFDHRFRNCWGWNCGRGWGWGWGYPWYGAYYDPYFSPWWWNTGSYYDQDYYNNLAAAQQMNQQNLEEQRMLRREEEDGDQDDYAPPRAPQRPQPAPQAQPAAPVLPNTVLVYRDQHKQEVQNYAIVGQTLWVFAPPKSQKVPLSELDVPATIKANDDRGVTFRVPGANEGQ